MIEFCPHCRSAILLVKREGKFTYACSKCGYAGDMSKKVVKTLEKPERPVFVVDKNEEATPKPKKDYWST